MKKLLFLIVAIVVLGLIVSGCIPVVPPAEQSNTGNLTKGTTINVPADYGTIQAAIDAAPTDETILVESGIYVENVTIGTSGVILQAVTRHGAVIEGTVMITADNVTVDGFSIKNFNQIPTPDWSGVYIPSGTGILVVNNLIDGTGIDPVVNLTVGIHTLYGGTAEATLEGNIVRNVRLGIYNQGASLLISNNTIENTSHCGIGIDTALGTVITGNTISNSGSLGIEVYGENVVANCNNITDNAHFGVWSIGPQVDATQNWWGDVSGPSGSGSGSGDAVSDYVDYEPWSFTPDPCEAKTMGFWKNHEESVDALLDEYGSIFLGDNSATFYFTVVDFVDAWDVFKNAKNKNANTMLAAQLLAAELNVAHLVHLGIFDCTNVNDYIDDADDFLSSHEYSGPGNPGEVKGKDKQPANCIKDQLELFNTGGCPDTGLCT